jgi:hypothetical protein
VCVVVSVCLDAQGVRDGLAVVEISRSSFRPFFLFFIFYFFIVGHVRPVLSVLLFTLLFHVAFYYWCHNLSRTITRGKEKATPFWKKQQCFKDCQMTNL